MDAKVLRAWWANRQGLDGSLDGKPPADVLSRAGWARSVGGSNPYLTLFARAGTAKEEGEKALASQLIHELPAARGCTYFLPAEDFALGLSLGPRESGDLVTAKKFLGVTDDEIEKLSKLVLQALELGPADPRSLKDKLGDAVRNLGENGKKRGVTTTLPPVLGLLQSKGLIRRVPSNGRLDTQKFDYALWRPSPLDGFQLTQEECYIELARRFFEWTGPATAAQFQAFAGLGVAATRSCLSQLKLVDLDGMLLHESDVETFRAFSPPKEPQYSLVASIDSSLLLRRDIPSMVDDLDMAHQVLDEKEIRSVGHLLDLPSHAILDRGRLIGLWEFDSERNEIAWVSWVEKTSGLRDAVAKTERFVRDELGDVRSFSLDSPASRAPRVAALRA
jgi:hypothetical protein